MAFALSALEHPIVQAPLSGGPSTPALAAAVCEAGGLGFVAAGYKAVDAVARDISEVRSRTDRPFGVNLFAPPAPVADPDAVARYAAALGPGTGEPRHHDDGWEAKLDLLARERPAIVSTTFGCPTDVVVDALHATGSAVWVTVTTESEARHAASVGADGLVVQGVEAGGHRGSFDDDAPGEIGLLALLQLVGAAVDLPLVAVGGLATGRAVAAVLAAGAEAAGLGTAFMLSPEAATSAAHAGALRGSGPTRLTRAFSGRLARGITNRFMAEHEADAPRAYPDVHYVTAPLRAAARERGDAEAINLWAGQAYTLAPRDEPAGEIVRRLSAEAREALAEAAGRFRM
jgi:nitronate monooxygenase